MHACFFLVLLNTFFCNVECYFLIRIAWLIQRSKILSANMINFRLSYRNWQVVSKAYAGHLSVFLRVGVFVCRLLGRTYSDEHTNKHTNRHTHWYKIMRTHRHIKKCIHTYTHIHEHKHTKTQTQIRNYLRTETHAHTCFTFMLSLFVVLFTSTHK